MPLVSVLLTSYNHERWLRGCLESALGQTHPDIEVIVVDDNSPDSSRSILAEFADRIKLVVNKENQGTYRVLDQALDEASGEFIAILNSDDLWAPNKIERQVATIGQHSLSHTGGIFIDENGGEIDGRPMGFAFGDSLPDDGDYVGRLLKSNCIVASSAMLRTDAAREAGGFDDGFKNLGDWNMWLKVAERGKFSYVNEPLTSYRVHRSNTISNTLVTQSEEVALREKWLKRAGEGHRFESAHGWACLGAARQALGQKSKARVAYGKSLRLMPWRLKTVARYATTLLGR